IGGQSAYYVCGLGGGEAHQFAQNESCAAGTGSFLVDQMGRLGLRVEDYSQLVEGARSIPRLSGRCAVFAKTDIIHRQQEGADVRDILLGLCYAFAKSYKATIVRGLSVEPPVALVGGVAKNAGVVRAFSDVFKLEEGQLIADESLAFAQAAGAALEAAERLAARSDDSGFPESQGTNTDVLGHAGAGDNPFSPFALADLRQRIAQELEMEDDLLRLDALRPYPYTSGAGYVLRPRPWPKSEKGTTLCYLGIDVGSTSTNLVLVDDEGQLLDAQYLRTGGDAAKAVREGLASSGERLGDAVDVRAVATTGSGRERMGKLVGADVVRDEITAQARAAAAADSQVDTVFEIGGQDSKFVSLKDGNVADFQMNKICAAGTGSFVEEQAARLGIDLSDFGPLALSSCAPIDLGERCTVFVETAINAALAKGAPLADVAAGVALSIVRNYLHKVVGTKPVGNHVVLQGGVAFNPAIVAAFASFYGDRLTVSPYFAVSGAVGAALLAKEAHDAGQVAQSAFRGFWLERASQAPAQAKEEEVQRNLEFFRKTQALLTAGYTGKIDPAKKTVGIPRALLMYKFFPLANAFFTQLGYNVLVTDESGEEAVAAAQEYAQGEVCFPVKLVYGHMRALVDAGVDYIFMPSVHTIRHAKSHVAHNFACPYMQVAPQLVAQGLNLEEHGIELLTALLDLDMGQDGMARTMLDVGAQLGASPHDAAKALMAGGFAVAELDRATEAMGDELLASLKPDERVIVVLARQYGVNDAVLNQGIPEELIRRGEKVIVLSNLRAHNMNVGPDHPGLCWPFGQHLVSGAKMIRRHPQLFMVYLTNHGCGPDTMMCHLIAEEMGDKPYLHIEVDEHFSKVGVVTRIEAFLNALDHYQQSQAAANVPLYLKNYQGLNAPLIPQVTTFVLPDYGIHMQHVAKLLRNKGAHVVLMPPDADALAAGHAIARTKEYLTFTALAGMALQACRQVREGAYGDGALHVLVPSSFGGEADAVYDRVLRGVLDETGFGDVGLGSLQVARLPWLVDDPFALVEAVLEADLQLIAGQDGSGGLPASTSATDHVPAYGAGMRVMVVGEWPLVFSDALAGGVWSKLSSLGVGLQRMPLSEYLLFLWREALEDDRCARSTAPMPIDGTDAPSPFAHEAMGASLGNSGNGADTVSGATVAVSAAEDPAVLEERYQLHKEVLDSMEARMQQAHDSLGRCSPFDSMEELRSVADAVFGRYRGSNGRYRVAKAQLAKRHAQGVVCVASAYENTQLAGTILAPDAGISVLNLSLDGALDASIEKRLESFVYYLS
ncbi:MAG: CoA activase, partial [Eggerthellaceae bacterium]|nr:CoA activase [Eggerthellaceae bacterium]